jgi:hypothetical protein
VFLIYEKLKGDESFWKPYFDVVEYQEPTCHWNKEVLDRLSSQETRWIISDQEVSMQTEWETLENLFKLYP